MIKDGDPQGGQKVGRKRSPRAAAAPPLATGGQNSGRCYGYVRVSSDEQATTGQSLEIQQQQLRGWAMQRGCVLTEVMVEAGVSGGVPFSERPEGSRLWAELCAGDVMVAAKLDRAFRSAADCLGVVEAFKARGISLYLLDLNGGADDVSGNGIARLFLTIVSAFSEFERDRIGERIRATKRAQRARGEYSGGVAPFGWRYENGKLVKIPAEQLVLRRIRNLSAQGVSLRAIAADLEKRGVKLSHMGVRKILRRVEG